jgi:RNA polymerase sigma-70 factor, ECF subfamily
MSGWGPWIEAGRAAWPALADAATDDAFVRFLEARLEPSVPVGPTAGDLYLACACSSGDARALEAFDRALLSKVGRFIARIDSSTVFADEVRQALRELLFVGASPKIAGYTGKGSLEGWLRISATRLALRLKQKQPEVAAPEPEVAPSPSSPAGDPEADYLKRRYRGELESALEEAVAALPDEERTWLKLYYLDGLTVEQIGRLYRVHASTVSRRLTGLQSKLLDELRARLGAKLGASAGEVDSLIGLVRSQMDLSLPGILRKTEH